MGLEDMDFSSVEQVNDNLPDGASEGISAKEAAQEKLQEIYRAKAQENKAKKFFQKKEKNVKKREKAIADFLASAISSGVLQSEIIKTLNTCLKESHSPYILLAGLTLLYAISEVEEDEPEEEKTVTNTFQILPYTSQNLIEFSTWLQNLEQSGFSAPEKAIQAIQTAPASLAHFLEVVMKTYKNLHPNTPLPVDLVEASEKLISHLEKILLEYIAQSRLS